MLYFGVVCPEPHHSIVSFPSEQRSQTTHYHNNWKISYEINDFNFFKKIWSSRKSGPVLLNGNNWLELSWACPWDVACAPVCHSPHHSLVYSFSRPLLLWLGAILVFFWEDLFFGRDSFPQRNYSNKILIDYNNFTYYYIRIYYLGSIMESIYYYS